MSALSKLAPATGANIRKAADLLRAGELVAFPTETVYGLGADATNESAVAKVFAAKGRPSHNPMIVHVANLATAERLGVFDATATRLVEHLWPGPFTVVLKRTKICPGVPAISAGHDTIALRWPRHPIAQQLILEAGGMIVAPSANPSGRLSPTRAEHVIDGLGKQVAMVLDDGPCLDGVESTVALVEDERVRILRLGAVAREDLRSVAHYACQGDLLDDERPHSPGQLPSHYAPHHPLRLNASSVEPGETLLAFGRPLEGDTVATLNLSVMKNLNEAASNLYAHLRRLDDEDCKTIAVMPIPNEGVGEAINDRLKRGAAPRIVAGKTDVA